MSSVEQEASKRPEPLKGGDDDDGEEEEVIEKICRICHGGDRLFENSLDVLDTVQTLHKNNLLGDEAVRQIIGQRIRYRTASKKRNAEVSNNNTNNNNNNNNNSNNNGNFNANANESENDGVEFQVGQEGSNRFSGQPTESSPNSRQVSPTASSTTSSMSFQSPGDLLVRRPSLATLTNQIARNSLMDDLISPCACKGTMKYVHKSCLNQWRYSGAMAHSLAVGASSNNLLEIASLKDKAFFGCERCGQAYKLKHTFWTRILSNPRFVSLIAFSLFMLLWISCILLFSYFHNSNGLVIATSPKKGPSIPILVKTCELPANTPVKISFYSMFRGEPRVPITEQMQERMKSKGGFLYYFRNAITSAMDALSFFQGNQEFFCNFVLAIEGWNRFLLMMEPLNDVEDLVNNYGNHQPSAYRRSFLLNNRFLNACYTLLIVQYGEPIVFGTSIFTFYFFVFVTPATHMVVNIIFTAFRAQKYGYLLDTVCLSLFLTVGLVNAAYHTYRRVAIRCHEALKMSLTEVEDCP